MSSKEITLKDLKDLNKDTLDSIAKRAHYLATQMIFQANIREKDKGDPKIGGHQSASASALHIMGALHLIVKSGFDHIANKPHASPTDHSYNYLLDLFLKFTDSNTQNFGNSNDFIKTSGSISMLLSSSQNNIYENASIGIGL